MRVLVWRPSSTSPYPAVPDRSYLPQTTTRESTSKRGWRCIYRIVGNFATRKLKKVGLIMATFTTLTKIFFYKLVNGSLAWCPTKRIRYYYVSEYFYVETPFTGSYARQVDSA